MIQRLLRNLYAGLLYNPRALSQHFPVCAALFTTAKWRNRLGAHHWMDWRIEETWAIHQSHCPVNKMSNCESFVGNWMELAILLSEISLTQEAKYCKFSFKHRVLKGLKAEVSVIWEVNSWEGVNTTYTPYIQVYKYQNETLFCKVNTH